MALEAEQFTSSQRQSPWRSAKKNNTFANGVVIDESDWVPVSSVWTCPWQKEKSQLYRPQAQALYEEIVTLRKKMEGVSPNSAYGVVGIRLENTLSKKTAELDELRELLDRDAPLALNRDGVPLKQVKTRNELKSGCWWFSQVDQQLFIADDPSGALWDTKFTPRDSDSSAEIPPLKENQVNSQASAGVFSSKQYKRRNTKQNSSQQNHHLLAVQELETARLLEAKAKAIAAQAASPSPIIARTSKDSAAFHQRMREKFAKVDQFQLVFAPEKSMPPPQTRRASAGPETSVVVIAQAESSPVAPTPSNRPVPKLKTKKNYIGGPTGFGYFEEQEKAAATDAAPPPAPEPSPQGLKRPSPEQPKQASRRRRKAK